jgi:hypothetical protein
VRTPQGLNVDVAQLGTVIDKHAVSPDHPNWRHDPHQGAAFMDQSFIKLTRLEMSAHLGN